MKSEDFDDYFSVHTYGPRGPRMVYVFGGWKSVPAYHFPLVWRLRCLGYGVIVYVPRRDIIGIGVPYSRVIDASRIVVAEAKGRMEHDKNRGTTECISFGISLGTLFAAELAKHAPDTTKLVLLSPFGDFEEHVRLWPKQWYFGHILASQPTSPEESGKVLAQIGIDRNLERLKGIPVFIGHSDKDLQTHTPVVSRMIQKYRASGVDLDAEQVHGGHLLAVIKFMAFHPGFVRFLSERGGPDKR